MADESNTNDRKSAARTSPLRRDRHDAAERPGGAYIRGDVVVDADGNPIEGLIVGVDGSIHQAKG